MELLQACLMAADPRYKESRKRREKQTSGRAAWQRWRVWRGFLGEGNLEGRTEGLRKEAWVSRDRCCLWSSVLETEWQRVVT